MIRTFRFVLFALCCGVFLVPALPQDEVKKVAPAEPKKTAPADPKKVYRLVPPEKLETILKDLKITYEKSKGKTAGVDFYDFEKAGYKIRMHNYLGKDLWIECEFAQKVTLDEINKWNVRAKFSRAVQLKGDKQNANLEAQLDCIAGVTDGIVRQFIERFDGELVQFSKFLTK